MSPHLVHAVAYAGGPRPQQHLVDGLLAYYHYGCDGFDDAGWGCGFRTVQSILSWLSPQEPPPSIPELQRLLGHSAGTRTWIGVQDAVVILDELHGAQVEVLPLRSGHELPAQLARIESHFSAGGGPLMVGGVADVYSKTVIGVRHASEDHEGALLILDPHYIGDAALTHDVDTLSAGGWAAWRPLSRALNSGSSYNIALPRPISGARSPQQKGAAGMARGPPESATNHGAAAAGLQVSSQWSIEVVASGYDSRASES